MKGAKDEGRMETGEDRAIPHLASRLLRMQVLRIKAWV
jgi:hypothetical protein